MLLIKIDLTEFDPKVCKKVNAYLFLKILVPIGRLNLLKFCLDLWLLNYGIKGYKSHSFAIMFFTVISIKILQPISITTD